MSAPATRLDRLVSLLDIGSSASIRATAAAQLGQIAALRVRGASTTENKEGAATGAGGAPAASDTVAASAAYRGTEGEWGEVTTLLTRVVPLLFSKSWDTRNAAAQAIYHVCHAAGVWDPDVADAGGGAAAPTKADPDAPAPAVKADPDAPAAGAPADTSAPAQERLSFADFSLVNILATGTKLLASAGKEYDVPELLSSERLQRAKKDLMGKLGLGFAGADIEMGVDMDSELQGAAPAPKKAEPSPVSTPSPAKPSPSPVAAEEEETGGRQLSARERNQLKRKRKSEGKMSSAKRGPASAAVLKSSNAAAAGSGAAAGVKQEGDAEAPAAPTAGASAALASGIAAAAHASLQAPPGEWPFRPLAELLSVELFSPTWESRHGAALGFRELFRTQGAGGGKRVGGGSANDAAHHAWCEDLAVRLLCVFALDRLGDFVFDQVVAPVRETASQTLAQLLPHMSEDLVRATHCVLLDMIRQDSLRADPTMAAEISGMRRGSVWEVRHAGLLGLKYEVAMRKDMLGATPAGGAPGAPGTDMLTDVLEVALLGLRDEDDDVRAVAAATLLPIAKRIATERAEHVPRLLDQLWACVSEMRDDLSSSTGGVMDLLASLYESPQVMEQMRAHTGQQALSELIPHLYPFFRHTVASVRLSVLNAVQAFLSAQTVAHDWVDERLVRLLFQNLVVEERTNIREATARAWTRTLAVLGERLAPCLAPHIGTLFAIVMTPIGTPIDFALFYRPARSQSAHDVDKGILSQDLTLVGVDAVIRGRLGAAGMLGDMLAALPAGDAAEGAGALLLEHLRSAYALRRCLAAVVAQSWAARVPSPPALLDAGGTAARVHAELLALLEAAQPASYAEMGVLLQRTQLECHALYTLFAREGRLGRARVPSVPTLDAGFSAAHASEAVHRVFPELVEQLGKARGAVLPALEEQRGKVLHALDRYHAAKETQDILVLSAMATAVISWQVLPEKLNPVVRSVMNSVKFEENVDLQARSAHAVSELLALCQRPGARANPGDKIVKNLCAFVCQDTSSTPVFAASKGMTEGIVSLTEADAAAAPRAAPRGMRGMALPDAAEEDAETRRQKLIRRGAELALAGICVKFGPALFDALPVVWRCSAQPLLDTFRDGGAPLRERDEAGQAVLDACSLLEVVVPHLDAALYERLTPLLGTLVRVSQSEVAVVRMAGARCFSAVARCVTEASMLTLVRDVVPLLGDTTNLVHRQGAVELISHTVRRLEDRLLPYVIFMVVPVLGRMSDSDESVRLLATNTFAGLVKMVPLVSALPDPPHFPPELLARRQSELEFLTQLLDGSKVQPYKLPVQMNAELRKYQLEGVSWMAFLAKYQLHGILCDDMGLGKTLQSITLLSCKQHERDERWRATQAPDARPVPSLIVCPPTLTGHWYHEIRQYSPNLRPVLYAGNPTERARLQRELDGYNAVIMSYDVVRNDIAALAPRSWFYCILDEGHVICSTKTKTTRAVKQIRAQHRLILSGTPIQNNVLELWSLFDFLMPGFLGSDHTFHERFAKPVLACRSGKPSAADQEAATLALEALHKQIVPFLLRRLKEDVLSDLPPKIIQDVECDLGDVQKQLYDEFVRSKARQEMEEALGEAPDGAAPDGAGRPADRTPAENGAEPPAPAPGRQHIFQTLQYLRKLANHPLLVLDDGKPAHAELRRQLEAQRGSAQALSQAPKLQALRQLLLDCGIGHAQDTGGGMLGGCTDAAAVSQHRVLVFCQMKQMLDVIERDLFKSFMPSVTYLRLDGGVNSDRRHDIVQRFNSDPSIDVLLLTTSVGGLGLTLTGADTVIFVEHDWNPMKDLQAMDRAHRLGQKKVVNVYRLITRNTLEAKIMGLQQFKMNIANTVVTQQNKGMDLMQTDQILDLFDAPSAPGAPPSAPQEATQAARKGKGISQKALLASLENMPEVEEAEYATLSEWRPDGE